MYFVECFGYVDLLCYDIVFYCVFVGEVLVVILFIKVV